MNLIQQHLQLALEKITEQKEEFISKQDFDTAALYRDAGDAVKKAVELVKRALRKFPDAKDH